MEHTAAVHLPCFLLHPNRPFLRVYPHLPPSNCYPWLAVRPKLCHPLRKTPYVYLVSDLIILATLYQMMTTRKNKQLLKRTVTKNIYQTIIQMTTSHQMNHHMIPCYKSRSHVFDATRREMVDNSKAWTVHVLVSSICSVERMRH